MNKNIFHRHKYNIICTGIKSNNEPLTVDIVCCKCGKCGTLTVEHKYLDKIMKQANNKKYLRIPRKAVISSEEFNL